MTSDLTDRLTGLPNKQALDVKLATLVSLRNSFALVICDVDSLLPLNDAHGHVRGDIVLKQIANIISSEVTNSEFAFRIESDGFAFVLEQKEYKEVILVAQAVRQKVAVLGFEYPTRRIYWTPTSSNPHSSKLAFASLTLSLGVAFYPQHGSTITSLSEAAASALYLCKQLHGDKIVVFGDNA